MLESRVSPSITRVTSTRGHSAQLMTVCGWPGPIAGSDGVAVAVELPLEQAIASKAVKTVTARERRIRHRVDPDGVLLLAAPHG